MKQPKSPPSSPKRNLLSTIIAGACIVVPVSIGSCGGYAEYKDAKAIEGQNERLMSVKSFLEDNREKLKAYAALSPGAMAQQAGAISAILTELIAEMKKAKEAADEIKKTDVRFNPVLFEELIIALGLAIRRLSPEDPKIGRLIYEAGRLNKSKLRQYGARKRGISRHSLNYLISRVKALEGDLKGVKSSIVALEKDGFESCSNNFFVDFAIKEKRGKGCGEKNSAFCKAVKAGVSEGELDASDLTEGQTVAIQRKLIAHNFLKEGQDTGVFDSASENAFSTAKTSEPFKEAMGTCKE